MVVVVVEVVVVAVVVDVVVVVVVVAVVAFCARSVCLRVTGLAMFMILLVKVLSMTVFLFVFCCLFDSRWLMEDCGSFFSGAWQLWLPDGAGA